MLVMLLVKSFFTCTKKINLLYNGRDVLHQYIAIIEFQSAAPATDKYSICYMKIQ